MRKSSPKTDSGPVAAAQPVSAVRTIRGADGLAGRRRRDALIMAVLALGAVFGVRITGQPAAIILGEIAALVALFAVACVIYFFAAGVRGSVQPARSAGAGQDCTLPLAGESGPRARRGRPSRKREGGSVNIANIFCFASLAVPLASRMFLKGGGSSGTAWEMVMLTMLGIAAVVLVTCSTRARHTSLSVICSGFLLLFTTAISDRLDTLYFCVAWVLICLWWMLANHWEQLEVHMPKSVHRRRGVRLGMVAFGAAVCGLAAMISWGRGPATRVLEWGVMPTSGGRQWTDPSARSGVGDGDAVVAAKNHAASFGAVESDIFLSSHQPSLYDLFDDVVGKPKLVKRTERAVTLANRPQQNRPRSTVQSQQGQAGFTTRRQAPPQPVKLESRTGRSLLHWVGPAGVRLALERFDSFDGVDWSHSAGEKPTVAAGNYGVQRQELGEDVWFFRLNDRPTNERLLGPARGDAVKIINLRSPRIPACANTVGVHIADVTLDGFFAVASDDSLHMPDRSQVPALTVVRLVTHEIDGDVLAAIARFPRRSQSDTAATEGMRLAHQLAADWTQGASGDWQRVERIVERLRSDFVFDRQTSGEGDDPLADFLSERRGGDHLFATAAAVMFRSLGINARLAAGFYASPQRYDRFAGHVDILPEDTHAWVEVLVDRDTWVAVEPTPGFAPTRLYRTLLRRIGAAALVVSIALLLMLPLVVLLWSLRWLWGEALCRIVWWTSRPLSPRVRSSVLVRLLDWRGRLAGLRRPAGVTPRHWVEGVIGGLDDGLQSTAVRFFDSADAIFYGPPGVDLRGYRWSKDADNVVGGLTIRKLMKAKRMQTGAA